MLQASSVHGNATKRATVPQLNTCEKSLAYGDQGKGERCGTHCACVA